MSDIQIEQMLDLYLTSFNQMRVVRWGNWWSPKFRPLWLIRFLKEDNVQHCGGMAVLAELIFDLAETRGDQTILGLTHGWVRKKIWLHDCEESIVGDSRAKDTVYYVRERAARWQIMRLLKARDRADLSGLLCDYPSKRTPEDRFVKVLDELQAWAFMFYIDWLSWSTRDFSRPETIKGYMMAEEFPLLKQVADHMLERMRQKM